MIEIILVSDNFWYTQLNEDKIGEFRHDEHLIYLIKAEDRAIADIKFSGKMYISELNNVYKQISQQFLKHAFSRGYVKNSIANEDLVLHRCFFIEEVDKKRRYFISRGEGGFPDEIKYLSTLECYMEN